MVNRMARLTRSLRLPVSVPVPTQQISTHNNRRKGAPNGEWLTRAISRRESENGNQSSSLAPKRARRRQQLQLIPRAWRIAPRPNWKHNGANPRKSPGEMERKQRAPSLMVHHKQGSKQRAWRIDSGKTCVISSHQLLMVHLYWYWGSSKLKAAHWK